MSQVMIEDNEISELPPLPKIINPPTPIFGKQLIIKVSDPVKVDDPADLRTEYLVEVETNLREFGLEYQHFAVRRRYKQFRYLHQQVSSITSSELPNFPGKKVFGRFKQEIVDERQKQFQSVCAVTIST